MSVLATGTAGHGSLPNRDNPVVHLVNGLHRIAAYPWPLELTPAVLECLRRATAALDIDCDVSDLAQREASWVQLDALLDRLGDLRPFIEMALRCSTTVTVLDAGTKMNVIPATARARTVG